MQASGFFERQSKDDPELLKGEHPLADCLRQFVLDSIAMKVVG